MLATIKTKTRNAGLPLLCIGALLCGLAACAPERLPRPSPDFVVMMAEESHTVRFGGESLDLDEEAQRRLYAFARDQEIVSAKEILLEGGNPEQETRQAAVASALRAAGAPKDSIREELETTGASAAVVVTLRFETVVPVACLSGDVINPGKLPPSCINQLNLMHMAEDPSDLLRGRKLAPASAIQAIRAKGFYERGSNEP